MIALEMSRVWRSGQMMDCLHFGLEKLALYSIHIVGCKSQMVNKGINGSDIPLLSSQFLSIPLIVFQSILQSTGVPVQTHRNPTASMYGSGSTMGVSPEPR